MGELRNSYNILLENLTGRDCSEDLGVGGRIIVWKGVNLMHLAQDREQ
jgi:hypothetical protein